MYLDIEFANTFYTFFIDVFNIGEKRSVQIMEINELFW